MSFNKRILSKAVSQLDKAKAPKKPRDIIKDPRGQWAHPGQNTRIPGGDITMQNVPYPVWAQPNVGPGMMMQPGQDYNFPEADYVDEFPQMEDGEYEEMELTDEEIEEYKRGGCIVEELPQAQRGFSTPTYVTDPNDPRLQGYKDSLDLYNFSNDFKNRVGDLIGFDSVNSSEDLFQANKSMNQPPQLHNAAEGAFYPHPDNPNIRVFGNWDKNKKPTKDLLGEAVHAEFIHPTIGPTGAYTPHQTWNKWLTGSGPEYSGYNLTYPKPKQPVIYRGEGDIPDPTDAIAIHNGSQRPQGMIRRLQRARKSNPTYEKAYENVDKEKYPTLDAFVADAEYYKKNGRNMSDQERADLIATSTERSVGNVEPVARPETSIEDTPVSKPALIKKDSTPGTVKPPQSVKKWVKHPKTGTWYQRQRPVKPEDLKEYDPSTGSYLQEGGERKIVYLDDWEDPRIENSRERMNLYNWSQLPNTEEKDYISSEDILNGAAVDYYNKYYSNEEAPAPGTPGWRGSRVVNQTLDNEAAAREFMNNPEYTSWPSNERSLNSYRDDIMNKYKPDYYEAKSTYGEHPYTSQYAHQDRKHPRRDNTGYATEPDTLFIEDNIDRELLREIYPDLTDADIDKHLEDQRQEPAYNSDQYMNKGKYWPVNVSDPREVDENGNYIGDNVLSYPLSKDQRNNIINNQYNNVNYVSNNAQGYLQESETHNIYNRAEVEPRWNRPEVMYEGRMSKLPTLPLRPIPTPELNKQLAVRPDPSKGMIKVPAQENTTKTLKTPIPQSVTEYVYPYPGATQKVPRTRAVIRDVPTTNIPWVDETVADPTIYNINTGTGVLQNGGQFNQAAYSDSLNLYNAYQFQKANQLSTMEVLGNDPAQKKSMERYYDNKGLTLEQGLKDRRNRFMGGNHSWDWNNYNAGGFSNRQALINAYGTDDPSAEKILNYYDTLPFNGNVRNSIATSPDLYHETIKPTGTYWDGSHTSPVYKKPVMDKAAWEEAQTPFLPTRPLEQIPTKEIDKQLVHNKKSNALIELPGSATTWHKSPSTGTWYQRERPSQGPAYNIATGSITKKPFFEPTAASLKMFTDNLQEGGESPVEPTQEERWAATMEWFDTHPYEDMPKWKKINLLSSSAAPTMSKNGTLRIPQGGNYEAYDENKPKATSYEQIKQADNYIGLPIYSVKGKPMVVDKDFNKEYLNTYDKKSIGANEVFHIYGRGLPYNPSLNEQYRETYPQLFQQQEGGQLNEELELSDMEKVKLERLGYVFEKI